MFIKGNFLYTPSRHELTIRENQYAHIENGVVTGFMTDLPETTGPETVVDYSQDIIIPAFVDLHIHAPQYSFPGWNITPFRPKGNSPIPSLPAASIRPS